MCMCVCGYIEFGIVIKPRSTLRIFYCNYSQCYQTYCMCTALRLASVSSTIHILWMIHQDLFLRYTVFCLVNIYNFSVCGVFLLKIQF